jgi:hypothetical protein
MRRALPLLVAFLALVPAARAAEPEILRAVPPAPVVAAPADNALLTATPVTFSGTITEPGDAIVISEAGVERGRVVSGADGTWETTVPATDGTHVYDVTAEDAAGDSSPPVTRTVRVDTTAPEAPEITSPAQDSAQNSTTVTLSGTAEPGASIAISEGGAATADANGAWTVTIAGVSEGDHEYTATATDEAQHTSAPSAVRRVRVDLTAPAAPEVSGDPGGFTLSAEAGAALACSLDGGAFEACASGVSYSGLGDGEHVLSVRAIDAAGNASTTDHRFTVAHTPAATPTPAPTPVAAAPTQTPIATPSYRKTVVLRPQAGRTLIKRSGDAAFTEIRARTAVPVGTVVDVKKGAVIVIAATPTDTETGKFSGGIFTARGTDLALSEKLRCGRARRLTGDGAGAFGIAGRYAKATGRGAKWTVEDTCKRTKIRVTRGVVAVVDRRRTKTVLIRSGRSYTARPKR